MNIKYIFQLLTILIISNTLICGCGGGDSSRLLSSEPPPSQSESSTIRADNPNRFHSDSRAFDYLPNSKIRDIENANNLVEKSRYGSAVYGKTTYQ